jgi:AraC family transcriptional regulator, transcriptional activator of the genes for pyochelin and ferripyochelin receptors
MGQRKRRWSKDDLDRLQQLKDYILANLSAELRLSTLCRLATMNEKKLNEGFLYVHGVRLRGFILEQRMQRAHHLLLESDMPIKRIAAESGYPDLSSFYRAFTGVHGFPPAALRSI